MKEKINIGEFAEVYMLSRDLLEACLVVTLMCGVSVALMYQDYTFTQTPRTPDLQYCSTLWLKTLSIVVCERRARGSVIG
jgi:hypothetical protein